MRNYKQFKQYTQVANGLNFTLDREGPYVLFYFSENSSFYDDYNALNLRKIDFRHVVVPVTKVPRTRLTSDARKLYQSIGLHAYSSNMQFPKNKNIIFDLSILLKAIDENYEPINYRYRAGFLIQNILYGSLSFFPNNYNKILLYTVNVDKDLDPSIQNRKIFPIVKQLKVGNFDFDDMLFNIIHAGDSSYRSLIKDGEYSFSRLLPYLKRAKPVDIEAEQEKEISQTSNDVMKKVTNLIPVGQKEKVRVAVKSYLNIAKNQAKEIESGNISNDDIEKVAVASLLYRASGNFSKAKRIAASIPKEKRVQAIKTIDKQFLDELLESQPSENMSSEIIVKASNLEKVVEGKTPEHIFDKRRLDFEVNLKKDLTNSFKMLENKEVKLKVKSFQITDKKLNPGELDPTDITIISVSLVDKSGNEHKIKINVPKIDPNTGTFRINGKTKVLNNQIIQCPITFPKPYESKFESFYSKFRIESRHTKNMNYLFTYMGGSKIPLLVLIGYAFGFKESLRKYGFGYEIKDVKPTKNDKYVSRINDNQYVYFTGLDTELKQELANSFIQAKLFQYTDAYEYEFGSKIYFNEIIIRLTGRIDSTYIINNNVENIVDPVSKQILINQQLPTELDQIIKYMATNCVQGKVIARNDLGNQRIRNSEVIIALAQSRILAAYTDYKAQILSGNQEAEFAIREDIVMSDFNRIENSVDMEYANPLEEMASLTKVTPIGKTVGGIPDKRALTNEALNVHPSYFGNLDLYDTPEGEGIGVVHQLTVDAFITSARGLFHVKGIEAGENAGLLSTTTAMIPFISSNDGNRIMMAASQAKQQVPLKNPEPPAVQSGYESLLTNVLSDKFIKRMPCDGVITRVSRDDIIITCSGGNKQKVDITPKELKSGSGKNTLSVFNPKVIKGQKIKKGRIIAEGSGISQGTISLGRSLLAAIMPYKGFNFEDGIAINKRLVDEDLLTSLHGATIEVMLSENDRLPYIIEMGSLTKKGQPLLRKTVGEIEELIGFDDEDGSSEYEAGQFIKKSPGGTVVDIEVFTNISSDKFPNLKSLIARTRKKYNNPTKDFRVRGRRIDGVLIKFKIEQELKISVPDKLANRHGNKGIISIIEENDQMPRTPWGEHLDIVLNPLGIIGRMNVGQIYELYSGLISRELGRRSLALGGNKVKLLELYSKVFSMLDNTKDKKFSTGLIKNLTKLNNAQFGILFEQTKRSGFVPIVIPPFQAPNYKNIIQAMKFLGLKSGYNLFIPEYGVKTAKPVPVGYMYMTKLEHIGEAKLHARSTGPVTSKTRQPTAGKRSEGGQRMGEMETYAFLSYNCPKTLAEFFGPLSDDHVTKNEMIADIIQDGNTKYRVAKSSPAKDLLNAYMTGLMLDK